MKKMQLQFSFYKIYDRIGEDVYYDYSVEYDWDSIIKNNFTKENFKIIPGGISSNYNGFFSQYSIDKSQWENKMKDYLLSSENDNSIESFLEELSSENIQEYDCKWS